MINTLVSLDADLASSIAFRYSCRLTQLIDMHLQSVHVEEPEKEGYPPGSGWVRSTWEKGMLQTAQEEISQLINADSANNTKLDKAVVRIGDREEELLREIQTKVYDLFVEGVLNSYDSQLFYKKVRSKLYKYAPCPIVLVKNLVSPERVALLVSDAEDVHTLVATATKLFSQARVSIDLVGFAVQKSGQSALKQKVSAAGLTDLERVGMLIDTTANQLAQMGLTLSEKWIVRDNPKRIGEELSEYGLVATCIPGHAARKSQVMDLLSRVPTATLLCK